MRISKKLTDLVGGDVLSTEAYIRKAIATHKAHVKEVHKLLAAKKKPLEFEPTENQVDFWAACYQVPKGYVASYGTLSRVVQGARGEESDRPRYARAAGKFMSQNSILAPVVPCHRVVGTSGNLTGFKCESSDGLLNEKATMLLQEGVPVEVSRGGDGKTRYVVRPNSGRLL